MTQQTKAQRLAYLIGCYCPPTNATNKAAAILVRQDELLRQALETILNAVPQNSKQAVEQTNCITAIRNHLEEKWHT